MGRKSTLMTPDPYHIPGYCGYVPQFKYKLGETFGGHTHKLLTDKSVASSGNPVLTETEPSSLPPIHKEDVFSSPVYDNHYNLGNQKYMPQMVPGYTGYIPKGLNHFGKRYAETCHYAVTGFKIDQQRYKNKMEEMRRGHVKSSSVPVSVQTPLKPVAQKPKAYLSMYAKQHSISPFYMPDGHPQKYFMSGYTGFIPKTQKYIGQGYPIITRNALREHAQECEQLEVSLKAPVILERTSRPTPSTSILYKKGRGLMPHYTGHIQGQKYKYGMTFGTSTSRAVSEIAS